MDWAALKSGLSDELAKIADVSTMTLKPETVLKNSEPVPSMDTPGLLSARRILDRVKTAAPVIPFNPNLPGVNTLTGAKKDSKKERGPIAEGKSLGGHTVGGAAAGRFLGWASHGPHLAPTDAASLHNKQWWGTAVGAGVGLGEFGRKRLVEHYKRKREIEKSSSIVSPAAQLAAGQHIGRFGRVATTQTMKRIGPTLQKQAPLIGHKGRLPLL